MSEQDSRAFVPLSFQRLSPEDSLERARSFRDEVSRRRTVREAGARRRMRWVVALLAAAVVGGLVAWMVFESSLLSVSEIVISGDDKADVAAITTAAGV